MLGRIIGFFPANYCKQIKSNSEVFVKNILIFSIRQFYFKVVFATPTLPVDGLTIFDLMHIHDSIANFKCTGAFVLLLPDFRMSQTNSQNLVICLPCSWKFRSEFWYISCELCETKFNFLCISPC